MGLTADILCLVFWLMIKKSRSAKLIFVLNWRRKDVFIIASLVTSTFVTSIQEILKSFLL